MSEETQTDQAEEETQPSTPAHKWTKADRDAAYEAWIVLTDPLIHDPANRSAGYEEQTLDTFHEALRELQGIMRSYNRPADSVSALIIALCRARLRPFVATWERRRRTLGRRGSDTGDVRTRFYDHYDATAEKVRLAAQDLYRIAQATPAVDERTAQVIASVEGQATVAV